MLEKIRKLKDRKGFTLVELIVVLVILAILAALLVPALTGYIDKANAEKVVAETRQVVMAAQSTISEGYGKAEFTTSTTAADMKTKYFDAIETLAEVKNKANWKIKVTISKTEGSVGQVKSVELWDGSYGCLYLDGQYYVKGDTPPSGSVPTNALTDDIVWAS